MAKRLAKTEAAMLRRHLGGVISTPPRLVCGDCPHETYLTTSISRSEHICYSCGEVFIDVKREKRYFGKGPK